MVDFSKALAAPSLLRIQGSNFNDVNHCCTNDISSPFDSPFDLAHIPRFLQEYRAKSSSHTRALIVAQTLFPQNCRSSNCPCPFFYRFSHSFHTQAHSCSRTIRILHAAALLRFKGRESFFTEKRKTKIQKRKKNFDLCTNTCLREVYRDSETRDGTVWLMVPPVLYIQHVVVPTPRPA